MSSYAEKKMCFVFPSKNLRLIGLLSKMKQVGPIVSIENKNNCF